MTPGIFHFFNYLVFKTKLKIHKNYEIVIILGNNIVDNNKR